MRLVGLLDSPYVRRVAISLRLMELPFTHEALSVFRNFDAFAAINPVVKAPSFVTDDGTVLMDSALILEHLERLVAPGRSHTTRRRMFAHSASSAWRWQLARRAFRSSTSETSGRRKSITSRGSTACRDSSRPPIACSNRKSRLQDPGFSETGRCRPTSPAR